MSKKQELVPCYACEGEGRIVIGERLVTREMARDAGSLSLEGSLYEYEHKQCEECEGTGLVPTIASLRRELEVAKKEIREQQLRLAVQNDIINGNNLMLDEAERRTLLRAIRGAVDRAEDTENENVALRRKAKALDKLKELLKTRCLSSWTSDSGEYFIDTDRGEYYQGNDLLSALESKEGK
jgi:DnaJ-class molecular chaperone